ncbi:acyl-CoA synthetase family member 2, mitochondrial-like [Sinocyclocheilus grahami]|uniref:acyl-CoA synthetase family member 2, mitochondrial-like n=1 Tax=Sinocyclocheilus grahami TaxID=75366 RepID=UPI0007AD17FC|nr:PREDICTED: acyl-CoA synthetase family member 2, mitochondrial-like [Sinocyclocheilus grahami]XP_016124231.1 PREDICTED: acyl-CoA synthetase family member 2, mitochondrial-like [Sinocyclocheilus grahami]
MSSKILLTNLRTTASFCKTLNFLQRPWTPFIASQQSCAVHVDNPPSIPTLTTSYVHGISSHSLLSSTVDQCLQRSVERHPDREALVFMQNGMRKTFAQFYQDVEQTAAGLLAVGLKRGDRLGMWGPNIYEWILMQFATAKTGIILVSVNPAYQLQEVEFALRKVQCNAVVCPTQFKTQRYCDMLRQLCPEMETASSGGIKSSRLPDLHTVIVTDSQQPGAFHLKDVMQAGSSQHYQQLQDLLKILSCDDPINIQFTSGTTGKPKGATLSHHNIVNNAYFIGTRIGYNWKKNVRICLPVPLYHCFGSVGGGIVMAVHGTTVIFPSTGYDGHANLVAIEKEKCTFMYGTPTMFIDMLSQPDLAQIDFSSVEGGITAGSPCPPEVIRKVINVTGAKEMLIGYGTTENSPVTFCGFPFDNIERKTETAGCICPHTEVKVVNPTTGEIVPLGAQGELMIRGYCVMLEYWKDDEKTQECITKDRWYKTGDIGSLDGYGYCKIEGRVKDLIIRGGENIYPAEIEQFLHTHPQIQEAQVVGVKDERMGEEVCACIRLKAGQECTAEEIKAYCKGKLAHYKVPRYVMFVQGYPLTVTGKIQKYKLREQTEKLLGL